MTDRVTNLNPAEFRSKHNSLEDRVAAIEAALDGISFDLTGVSNNDTLAYSNVAQKFIIVDVAD